MTGTPLTVSVTSLARMLMVLPRAVSLPGEALAWGH